MSFQRPTISDIWERVKGDIRSGLGLTAILRRSFEFAIGKAITGASHELHGLASWIAKQHFVDQMDDKFLDRFGAIYQFERNPATYTKLNVTFTGVEGTAIPINSELVRSDGVAYETEAALTIQTATTAVAEITTVETVADVASSLNGAYFLISSPTTDYYVWLNTGTATDPLIELATGVEVAISENDSANTIATALQTEINALTDFNASVSTDTVTITCATEGVVTDPVDGATPTGFTLTVTTEGVDGVVGGEVTGVVVALETGSDSNTENGDELTFSSPITDIDSVGTVVSTDTEGEDSEGAASYRARLLDRVRQAPHGGNANDYVQWALSVSGVTRAWVLPNQLGAGTVLVYFVEDDEADIFPGSAKIAEVQEYIDSVRPITADVTVVAPTPVDLDLTIKITPYTEAVRAAVTAEIEDMLVRHAVPHGVLRDAGTGTTYNGAILISKINEAISIAEGEDDHELVSPTSNFTLTTGQMARLGTITWQAL